MKAHKRIIASAAAFTTCFVMLVSAPAAMAWYFSDEVSNSYMTGSWRYNWSYSEASCMSRAAACTAEAIQDQYFKQSKTANTRNASVRAYRYGSEQDTRDSARIY